MDLKGAFTLMSYKSTNTQMFAIELVKGLVCIYFYAVYLGGLPRRRDSKLLLELLHMNYGLSD